MTTALKDACRIDAVERESQDLKDITLKQRMGLDH